MNQPDPRPVDLAPMRSHLRSQYRRIMDRYDEAIR
jgi:hypothetical protein